MVVHTIQAEQERWTEDLRQRQRKLDFAVFDDLPCEVRETVHNTAVCITADSIAGILRVLQQAAAELGSSGAMVAHAFALWCEQFEEQDLRALARTYLRETGRELPHLAAGASVMRSYGPPRKLRRRPCLRPT